jgi:hypothetical protein
MKRVDPPPGRGELIPQFVDTDLIVTPDDNPEPVAAIVNNLVASFLTHGQLVPGWICPAPDLPEHKRLCLEGNHRLAACRAAKQPFWAFDLGRHVSEEERIKLTFQHNHSRRVMSRDEVAERAARYIELTGCTAGDAAKLLNISGPTLSRAFGERRIPPELRSRADRIGLSIRSLIAAMPVALMGQAIDFAERPNAEGKPMTRDQVAAYLRQLKKGSTAKTRKAKVLTLRMNGRTVTLTVGERDTAATVAEDFKAIASKFSTKLADISPDGWPFHFA